MLNQEKEKKLNKPKIKIFVSHRIDLDSETIDNPLFVPVRCGAVYDKRENITMLGDDTGDNISEKRNSFSELTVQYWAWKNIEADYYGLCHYRRYLSFNDKLESGKEFLNDRNHIVEKFLNIESINRYNLNDEQKMASMIGEYDAIIAVDANVSKIETIKGYKKSIYEYYKGYDGYLLDLEDIDKLKRIINTKFSEYTETAEEYFNGNRVRGFNCFVMKKSLFKRLCEFQFGVLFELEKIIARENVSQNKKRTCAYLSEILYDIFILNIKQQKYKIKETNVVLFNQTEKQKEIIPVFERNNIPICLFSSDEYVPYCGTLIQSIISNSLNTYNYDILILERNIKGRNRNLLESLAKNFDNVSVRVINVEAMSSKMKVNVHSHFSLEGCFRVLLFSEIFKNYNKVISLDSDLIIEKDIAQLYQTNIEDKYMAASTDILMDYLLVTKEPSGGNTGNLPTPKYLSDYLKIEKGQPYFNTGVAIFNIEKSRKDCKFEEIINLINKKNYWFLEQDVLNIALGKNSLVIDERWNTLSGDGQKENIKAWVSVERYNEYIRNRTEYYIIHYAGGNKPWINPYVDFADVFFKYARLTPWYEIIMHKLCWQTSEYLYNINNATCQMGGRSGARIFADRLLPKGTRRRELVKKVIPKGSFIWNLLKKIYLIISPKNRIN